ncbi:UPF0303 protein [Dictyobacter alpinus]|uniref:UPF0303 protein KDA_72790 n=1 Tax=Dictyobacter alpinus TaxID=2014873 RepID=A0A402BKC3_9CHLR|nr:heme-degrading domain-containing protein [Dictyobacter alpinus]GCE31795.1 UPF0303 protein [Dictyobacter alpinus]
MSTHKALLQDLLQQEEEIQFSHFSNELALEVGLALLKDAKTLSKPVAIDITRNGLQLFHFAMEGTAIDNGEWIRRKNNVVNRFSHSSFYIGTSLKNAEKTLEEKYLISSQEYAAHGGAFPLIIRGIGPVGTVTVSGLPQQEDHELVVRVLRQFVEREKQA